MYNNTFGSTPSGDDDFELSKYGGTGMTQYVSRYNPISIEMEIAWIQDPVKKQYRQICNDIEPFYIPNNL